MNKYDDYNLLQLSYCLSNFIVTKKIEWQISYIHRTISGMDTQ